MRYWGHMRYWGQIFMNVKAANKQTAKSIELAARDGNPCNIMRHKGHDLSNGSKGMPHYQTDNVFGHTFWSGVVFLISIFDPTDALTGELDDGELYVEIIYEDNSPGR